VEVFLTMFGHDGGQDEVAIDAALASDLAAAEEAVSAYLRDPSDGLRNQLLLALEALDEQINQSDAYESSVVGSGALGLASKGSVVGETSAASAAEEIPEAELQAQTVLIRAAKQEVTTPSAEHLAALEAAQRRVSAIRSSPPPHAGSPG
jgi:hypothetical protein